MGRFLPLTQLYRKIELPPVLFTVATAPICVIGELSAEQTEGSYYRYKSKMWLTGETILHQLTLPVSSQALPREHPEAVRGQIDSKNRYSKVAA